MKATRCALVARMSRMTSVRYLPRSFTPQPWSFGMAQSIEWNRVEDNPAVGAQLRAAQVQHAIAYAVRCRVLPKGTLASFAASVGIDAVRATLVVLQGLRGAAEDGVAGALLGAGEDTGDDIVVRHRGIRFSHCVNPIVASLASLSPVG